MINILFVDDEPNILEGLQRTLRSLRHEWEMSFAGSGAQGLALLEEKSIDVVVSDMKMPGMDGSQFLNAVMEKYPHIVRIILSGYSEKEMILKSVGIAHQYLSKPCDAEILKATVLRVCALRNLLTDENLRRLVSQLPNVPSLPLLYTELVDELAKNDPSTKKVGEIVKKDIGMTVKILQIVNSAFFGLRRRISDSKEAVEFLGLDTIASLTLSLGVISQFEAHLPKGLFATIWNHSVAVGALAAKIAGAESREVVSDAFTAGLLHDIGRVVLAINLPKKFESVKEIAIRDGVSRVEAERRVFGATHSEVGGYLLGLWGLPSTVVQAVAFHDTPGDSNSEGFDAITAVHAANVIQGSIDSGEGQELGVDFDMEYLGKLGLLDKIPVWRESCSAMNASV
ncbi:MAG: response regulator [Acidobacteriota bacterium]